MKQKRLSYTAQQPFDLPGHGLLAVGQSVELLPAAAAQLVSSGKLILTSQYKSVKSRAAKNTVNSEDVTNGVK